MTVGQVHGISIYGLRSHVNAGDDEYVGCTVDGDDVDSLIAMAFKAVIKVALKSFLMPSQGSAIARGLVWCALRRLWQAVPSVGFRPILLKKSAVFSKAEKYASEIEILNVRRAFQAEISRRSVLKRRFHRSILRHSEKTDFFNRVGQKQPVDGAIVVFRRRLHPMSKVDCTS